MNAVDARTRLPVSPFVRRRWRRRLGLPEEFVVRLDVTGGPEASEDVVEAALFTCSAAVVGREYVALALALGTPVVCDADVAGAIGATDGTHVTVASGAGVEEAARALAGDDIEAARLARNGRRLVVDRSTAAAPAPGDRLGAALDELGTPPGHPTAERLRRRVTISATMTAAAGPPGALLPDEALARRLAGVFGVPLVAPVTDLAPPSATPRSIRERLAGKSAREIAVAVIRRLRPSR
jgi:hypothetical protein